MIGENISNLFIKQKHPTRISGLKTDKKVNELAAYLSTIHRQPIRVDSALFLERPFEGVGDVLHTKRADSTSWYAVRGRGERPVY